LTLRGGAEMTVEPLVATNKVVKTAGLLGGDSALEEPAVLGGDDVEGKICTWDHSVCKPGSEYYCYDPCWELGQCGYASCLDWDCYRPERKSSGSRRRRGYNVDHPWARHTTRIGD